MREKKQALIITFSTTTDAMGMEKYCINHQLPGRLIPVPREITAGCGLAWKTAPEEKARFTEEMSNAGLQWAAMHLVELWG